ncbi:hypothetical protein Ddye_023871 [Dipteronia dyeriana]|uniref:Uncharacterized protein n=1 Tax=Dipteronia dyeriana TaxID=168575 RepID=A0AAD9WTN0_9ROSI|nr:hypothetical protein Ddye_023871 [Dipteronia dyeriana]
MEKKDVRNECMARSPDSKARKQHRRITAIADPTAIPGASLLEDNHIKRRISLITREIENINIFERRLGDPGTNKTSVLPTDKRDTMPSSALTKERNQPSSFKSSDRLLMKFLLMLT